MLARPVASISSFVLVPLGFALFAAPPALGQAPSGADSVWMAEAERSSDVLSVTTTVGEIRAAKASGRLGLVFGFQDGVPFEDDLDRLDRFYQMGLRIVQPTYNVQNKIGTGCLAPNDSGLTELGREAVARMESLGILLDFSHRGPQTTIDGIRAATGPVSITHSGCKAVFAHPRSKNDATMRETAAECSASTACRS